MKYCLILLLVAVAAYAEETATVAKTTPAESGEKTQCTSHGNVYAPNPGSDCKKFVQWTEDNDEVKVIQDCGQGLIFDIEKCICNWEKLTKCLFP